MAPHALHGLIRSGLIAPVRPDRMIGMLAGLNRSGLTAAAASALGAARYPYRPAVIDDAGVLTFAELEADSAAVAGALRAAYAVGPGRTVGVLCRNHRWFVLAVLATSRLGANLVLLNTESAAPQLGTMLDRERVDVLIADAEFDERIEDAGYRKPLVWAWWDGQPPGDTLQGMVDGGAAGPPRPPRQGKVVVMTSGTTGTPKGAPRQPDPLALLGPMASMLTRVPVRSGEPMLVAPPVFHTLGFGYLLVGLFVGTPLVLQRRFDPVETLDALRRHRAGSLIAVPVMLSRLLEVPADRRHRPPALRAVVSSGSALSPALAAAFMDAFGDVLHNLYGSSEIAWASLATPSELRSAPGTVGRPPHGTTVRILDPAGAEVARGQVGRIFVGSGLAFEGYTDGDTRETVDGLVATGDLGHFDRRGLLFVDGRDDDMIVSGGENVYPQEVEECLAGHPAVAEVAVVGVPDDSFGQRLAAHVVLRPGATATADDLKDHVKANLARFKVPRDVHLVDTLPRNATGKIMRNELGQR
jgi:fatty-acyl-CoA synthase